MIVCTFLGHHDCPERIRPELRETIIGLIRDKNVDMFYVGNQGHFDAMVHSVLRNLKMLYPQIGYAVVLAYMPGERTEDCYTNDDAQTMLPEGIESAPKRYAIPWRNRWMLEHSDYVITYITHSWGGAAKYAQWAEKHGMAVYNINDVFKD